MLFEKIKQDLIEIISNSFDIDINILNKMSLDIPPNNISNKFHLSTNIGMISAQYFKKSPFESAKIVSEKIKNLKYITNIDIIQPGFINFCLNDIILSNFIQETIVNGEKNLIKNIGNNEKINIEFCSANPTGPLHVGHTRGAIIGDVIATILLKSGYNVTREYLINDRGTQIDTLLKSAKFREEQIKNNDFSADIPEGFYPGDYLTDVVNKLIKENQEINKINIVNEIMSLIKNTLNKMKIHHDVFISEQKMSDDNLIIKSEKHLQEMGMLYNGYLEKPKFLDDKSDWEPAELLLIKTKQFGDDSDRPLKKRNGDWAYIAQDVAYSYDKFLRGARKMIVVLGADHKGYVKRITAVAKAITDNQIDVDIKLSALVNFTKNGEIVKMSKRKGNFLLADDVLDEINIDILRFNMLTKKSDTVINFDFELTKQQTKENPLWYIQYAYSRCSSVLNKYDIDKEKIINFLTNTELNFHHEQKTLLVQCTMYTKFIELSAKLHEPNLLTNYLINLATNFHFLWSLGGETEELKFIQKDNNKTTMRNLSIVYITREILKSGLSMFKIKGMERM